MRNVKALGSAKCCRAGAPPANSSIRASDALALQFGICRVPTSSREDMNFFPHGEECLQLMAALRQNWDEPFPNVSGSRQ